MQPSLPPLLCAATNPYTEAWPLQLSRRARKGELLRIRRGVYVSADGWEGLKPWERYLLRLQAVERTSVNAPIFSHESAAQLWGLPLTAVPREIHVLTSDAAGGRSRAGVRRHPVASFPDDVVTIDGHSATGKITTVCDIAVTLPFPDTVAVMDRLFSETPLTGDALMPEPVRVTPELVANAAAALRFGTSRRKVLRAVAFADPASGSPGESISRANIHLAGFPAPALQQVFTDRGRFVARTDFYWKDAGLVGEFDGMAKYSRGEYLQGRIPEDVLAAEKIREDRLRSLGLKVCRWTWKTALDRELLSEQLLRAGLGRARRPARLS